MQQEGSCQKRSDLQREGHLFSMHTAKSPVDFSTGLFTALSELKVN